MSRHTRVHKTHGIHMPSLQAKDMIFEGHHGVGAATGGGRGSRGPGRGSRGGRRSTQRRGEGGRGLTKHAERQAEDMKLTCHSFVAY